MRVYFVWNNAGSVIVVRALKNTQMNTKTQGFPLGHCNAAVIDAIHFLSLCYLYA